MDRKRFTEIEGREAANRLLDDLDVYSEDGNRYYMQDGTVWMESGELAGHVQLTIAETLSRKWYVKKPFDVRVEMLARPNEWVGAYKDNMGYWHKVGLDLQKMQVTEASILSDKLPYQVRQRVILSSDLDNCVPIDEAIEEVM